MSGGADVLIIGGGIAGASAGYYLARDGARVVLLEREAQPGYHATGRSAALYSEIYGPPVIRQLSSAGRPFLVDPPEGFAEHPLLTPRGLLTLGTPADERAVADLVEQGRVNGARVELLDEAAVRARVPILREGRFVTALFEPGAMDIDVHALHWGYLRGLKKCGGEIHNSAEVEALQYEGGHWRVTSRRGGVWEAPVVVNAAGAWADEVAQKAGIAPVGLVAKRRTAVMIELPDDCDPGAWPLTGDSGETFYFRPDGKRIMLSPADATPVPPQDVQPEIIDVATVVERLQEVTTVEVQRPGQSWAGLRTFAPDGAPVVGFAGQAKGFFWLAGQGGYGIQTAPSLGRLCAILLQGNEMPEPLRRVGFEAAALSPQRSTL